MPEAPCFGDRRRRHAQRSVFAVLLRSFRGRVDHLEEVEEDTVLARRGLDVDGVGLRPHQDRHIRAGHQSSEVFQLAFREAVGPPDLLAVVRRRHSKGRARTVRPDARRRRRPRRSRRTWGARGAWGPIHRAALTALQRIAQPVEFLAQPVQLLLEFIDGPNLKRFMQTDAERTRALVFDSLRQAALAMAHVHQKGFVHLDIKPENLMLTEDGTVKVVDFGLSKLIDATQDPESGLTSAGLPQTA